MKIRQLSLFLENRPGQLRFPCKVLGDAGIDILTHVARRHRSSSASCASS